MGVRDLDLPEPTPTPPGIPAEHIDPDDYRSLIEFEMKSCPECGEEHIVDDLLPPTTVQPMDVGSYTGITCPSCEIESDYTAWGLNALFD